MIQNRKDYKRFLRADLRLSNKESTNFFVLYFKNTFKPTYRFKLLLRTCEYFKNAKRNRILYLIVKYLKYRLSLKLSFSIPENVIGEGLQLTHYGTIIINKNARIGNFCKIHACVNIGASGGIKKAPHIGDMVYIGPGAKIYGDIQIASRIAIAANAAVGKSFLNSDKLIGGVPAKEIGDVDIMKIIKVNKSLSN